MPDNNEENGKWVTINGTHVFIRDGETPEQALSRLQDKPKRELYYRVDRGSYHIVIPESEKSKYMNDWRYNNYGEGIFEELNLDEYFDFIDNLDPDKPLSVLKHDLRRFSASVSPEARKLLLNKLYSRIADHQESLARSFLSKINKSKDISVEESLISINQSRYNWSKTQNSKSSEYAQYTYNCQRCAQAFILRYCHGYEVIAKPCERVWDDKKNKFVKTGADIELNKYAKTNDYNTILDALQSNYNGWDRVIFNQRDVTMSLKDGNDIAMEIGYSGTEDQLRWIKRTVKKSGPGSAYICSVCWKGTREDDGTYSAHVFNIINDNGKVKFLDPQTGEDCSIYFTDKQIVPKKTEIFRADNCRLNGTMMKEVVQNESESI